MTTQLFAVIKASSKYYGQGVTSGLIESPDSPFPVEIVFEKNPLDYPVHGIGNKYRLEDVHIFVINDQGVRLQLV
jgi:hypothetical protein